MFTHIKSILPEIQKEIKEKIKHVEDRLKDLGPALPSKRNEKIHLLWNMITDFCSIFRNTISGKYDPRQGRSRDTIQGGAKIKNYYYKLFREYTGKFSATSDYADFDIEKAIIMHEGDSIPGFPSVDVFIYLLQPQLEKLKVRHSFLLIALLGACHRVPARCVYVPRVAR